MNTLSLSHDILWEEKKMWQQLSEKAWVLATGAKVKEVEDEGCYSPNLDRV